MTEEFIQVRPPRKRRPRRVWHKRAGRNNRRVNPGGPSPESKLMLGVISLLVTQGRLRIYEGTVPAKVKAKRRAKSKVAKQSRKVNRGR